MYFWNIVHFFLVALNVFVLQSLKAFFMFFVGYIPNLTSVKDNLKIYNESMFFKTLLERTRKTLFNIRALSLFKYSTCFASLG
jgi:hypothetical protein